MTVWLVDAQGWGFKNFQQGGTFVVMHGRYTLGSRLRVVLDLLCLFLSDEGFGVRRMTHTHDWDIVNVVLTHDWLGMV